MVATFCPGTFITLQRVLIYLITLSEFWSNSRLVASITVVIRDFNSTVESSETVRIFSRKVLRFRSNSAEISIRRLPCCIYAFSTNEALLAILVSRLLWKGRRASSIASFTVEDRTFFHSSAVTQKALGSLLLSANVSFFLGGNGGGWISTLAFLATGPPLPVGVGGRFSTAFGADFTATTSNSGEALRFGGDSTRFFCGSPPLFCSIRGLALGLALSEYSLASKFLACRNFSCKSRSSFGTSFLAVR